MTFLVLGATGNVGGALVDDLLERGESVRAVSRHERQWPDGVEGFVGDPGKPDSLAGAARGVAGAFLMSGYEAESRLLDELDPAARVVLLSASSAELGESGNAMGRMHLGSERAVERAGHAHTFLRPCSFQSNVLRWKDQLDSGDRIEAPFGDVPSAMTAPADIAAVAAAALTESGLDGTHRLSGPESLDPAAQVAILAEVLGRPLTFRALDDEAALPQLTESIGADYAQAAFDIFRGHPEFESPVQPTVERVLGRPPGSLREWVERNRDAFA